MLNSLNTTPQTLPVIGIGTPDIKKMGVSVRRAATGADAIAIAEISHRGFLAAHQQAFTERDMRYYLSETFNPQQIIAEMGNPHIRFLVAEVRNKIVGTVRLSKKPPPHPIRLPAPMELSRLYLYPQWTGQGVGSALMLQALGTVPAAGFKSCWLSVWERNGRAIEFYHRWDFRPIGTEILHVGQSAPVGLVMSRLLSP
ncbi:GNAT family N-acetyltransferase [Candidatus Leptofilum sp.]|uniref:GNAT family N-acetyltransferase n=1 Tax=Candidatus Leptofilum sp. TaxID=3241576 RepID=UPI003B5C2024